MCREMNRTQWAFAAGAMGILAAVLVLCSIGPKEPAYHGRSLSSWLEEWGESYNDRTNPATIAIRAIGSNGVPILLARLAKEQSPDERKFWAVVGKVLPESWNPLDRDISRAVTAAEAINLLGMEAKSAFQTLTNLMTIKAHRITAAIGLAGMGHEGVAVLLQALTNQDFMLRFSAANALQEAGSDFDKVVPALLEVVKIGGSKKENFLLRGAAASALIRLHKEPDLVVPVFSEFLTSPDAGERSWGATLLKGLGPDAKAAVPLLLKLRTDEDRDVRAAAEAALKEIAPATSAKAGLK